jgi:hypothetical protein
MPEKLKTTLSLDKELYNKAKKIASNDARSFNSLVVKLLQDYVRDNGGGN